MITVILMIAWLTVSGLVFIARTDYAARPPIR